MKKYILLAGLFLFCLPATGCFEQFELEHIVVISISDGDSFKVLIDSTEKRVRLVNIDAPEIGQPYGRNSRRSLSQLIYRKRITLLPRGYDKYGRILAEVKIGEKNINIEQIRRGLAWHYKRNSGPVFGWSDYELAEQQARHLRIGLWSEDDPVPPWVYRMRSPRGKQPSETKKDKK